MIEEFIKKVDLITNLEFRKKIKKLILFVKENGNIQIIDNRLIGKIKDRTYGDYILNVVISDTMVEFTSSYKNGNSDGKIIYRNDGTTHIKYNEQKIIIFPNIKDGHKDKKSDSYNVTTDTKIHVFDETGVQTFRYEEVEKENYYRDKKTGKKTLHAPSCFENYVERRYSWRADNDMIIVRVIRNYTYPNLTDQHILCFNNDSYLIGKNICPNSKKLPIGGSYIWIDKELYRKYVTNQCSVDEVWENRGNAYQKKK